MYAVMIPFYDPIMIDFFNFHTKILQMISDKCFCLLHFSSCMFHIVIPGTLAKLYGGQKLLEKPTKPANDYFLLSFPQIALFKFLKHCSERFTSIELHQIWNRECHK